MDISSLLTHLKKFKHNNIYISKVELDHLPKDIRNKYIWELMIGKDKVVMAFGRKK